MQSIKEHNLKANHNLLCQPFAGQRVCMQSIKEHNLKANHNHPLPLLLKYPSVCNLSKNTIWKQITTDEDAQYQACDLYAIYQRTQSESKSQRVESFISVPCFCMQSIKEHNLKANHNLRMVTRRIYFSVCNLSKNTIWKQITTTVGNVRQIIVCMQSIKEHNLKANHNKIRKCI